MRFHYSCKSGYIACLFLQQKTIQHYSFTFNAEDEDESSMEFLRDCIGVRIRAANLVYFEDRKMASAVATLVGRIRFRELNVIIESYILSDETR